MRKIVMMLTAAAGAMPISLAGAAAPPKKPAHPTKPKVCKVANPKGVTYIVRGALVQDATATEMLVDVTSVNNHAKKALAGPTAKGAGAYSVPMLTVSLDACSRVDRSGKGKTKRTWALLKAGDRVVVAFSAKRGTAYADLGAARRVVDRGPKRSAGAHSEVERRAGLRAGPTSFGVVADPPAARPADPTSDHFGNVAHGR